MSQPALISTTRSAPLATAAIRIRGLCKSFGSHHVLNGFDLDLHEAENIAVLGRSGSGKSVLIKCIIGLLEPDAGSIEVLGRDVSRLDETELDRLRASIGFLFQSNALYDSMTVRENLEFPLRRHWIDVSRKKIDADVAEVLENVGLGHTVDMMPAELSGGMRKRIALARTLILRPSIILYDEPTTGLDPITSREISELIVELQQKYKTAALIISHDLRCIRITADRTAVLIDGKRHALGTYEELERSQDPQVTQFFQ